MTRNEPIVLYVVEQDGRIIYTESNQQRAIDYRDMFYKEAKVVTLLEVGSPR